MKLKLNILLLAALEATTVLALIGCGGAEPDPVSAAAAPAPEPAPGPAPAPGPGPAPAPAPGPNGDPMRGAAVYTSSNCGACHGPDPAAKVSGIDRGVTVAALTAAYARVGAMAGFQSSLSAANNADLAAYIASRVAPAPPRRPAPAPAPAPALRPVPAPPATGGQTTSSFVCPSTEAEKNSSTDLIRLTGPELRNTYAAILPAPIWSGLSNSLYLLPPDNLDGRIENFVRTYTDDAANQISRFNEQVASQITLSNANVSAFYGSCATLTSFPKACFDSFLTTKAQAFFARLLNRVTTARCGQLFRRRTVCPTSSRH